MAFGHLSWVKSIGWCLSQRLDSVRDRIAFHEVASHHRSDTDSGSDRNALSHSLREPMWWSTYSNWYTVPKTPRVKTSLSYATYGLVYRGHSLWCLTVEWIMKAKRSSASTLTMKQLQ